MSTWPVSPEGFLQIVFFRQRFRFQIDDGRLEGRGGLLTCRITSDDSDRPWLGYRTFRGFGLQVFFLLLASEEVGLRPVPDVDTLVLSLSELSDQRVTSLRSLWQFSSAWSWPALVSWPSIVKRIYLVNTFISWQVRDLGNRCLLGIFICDEQIGIPLLEHCKIPLQLLQLGNTISFTISKFSTIRYCH